MSYFLNILVDVLQNGLLQDIHGGTSNPTDTLRNDNVVITSKIRFDIQWKPFIARFIIVNIL